MVGTYVDEDVAVAVFLLEEERICRTNNVGFCTKVGEGIKLLQGCVRSEKAALVLCVSVMSYRYRYQAPTFPNIWSGSPMYASTITDEPLFTI